MNTPLTRCVMATARALRTPWMLLSRWSKPNVQASAAFACGSILHRPFKVPVSVLPSDDAPIPFGSQRRTRVDHREHRR